MVGNSKIVNAMMPHSDGYDRHAPEQVAPLVVYLASEACHFTGRIFAMEGPDLAIYTPWSVERQYSRPGGWSAEAVAEALADHPQQAEHQAFFPNGTIPFRLPPGRTLKALAAVRASAVQ